MGYHFSLYKYIYKFIGSMQNTFILFNLEMHYRGSEIPLIIIIIIIFDVEIRAYARKLENDLKV